MEQNKVFQILRIFLSARFPHDIETRVQKWIINNEKVEEKEQASFDYWDKMSSEMDASTHSALRRVNQRIGYRKRVGHHFLFNLSYCNRTIIRVAAIFIPVCLMLGSYLYYSSLENKLMEVSTAYGETKHLLLPDSSEVWLNAGTTLKYKKDLGSSQHSAYRLIHLNGEAYFSVRKNKKVPFIVQTQQLTVKVLGTKFNVKAYPEDPRTITTLTSGRVEVSTENKKCWILNPNQQISYANNGTSVDITEINPADTQTWLDGHLIFINSSFDEIVATLERRFNVSITNYIGIALSKRYTIKFLKNENLDEVLNVLKEVIGFTYQKNENLVIIK